MGRFWSSLRFEEGRPRRGRRYDVGNALTRQAIARAAIKGRDGQPTSGAPPTRREVLLAGPAAQRTHVLGSAATW